MNDDYWTQRAMRHSGGEFVKRLAHLFVSADVNNRALIKVTWPTVWTKYAAFGVQLKSEDEAKELEPSND